MKNFNNLFQLKVIVVPIKYTLETSWFGFNDTLAEILCNSYWKVFVLDDKEISISITYFEREKYDAAYIYDLLNINGNNIKFTNNKVICNMLETLFNSKNPTIKFQLAFNLI